MKTRVDDETAVQLTAIESQRKRGVKWTVIGVLIFMTAVMALFLNKITTPRVLSQIELRANGTLIFDQPRQLKSFKLIDHQHRLFGPENLKGQWSLIFFGFTACPDVCPTTLSLLKQVKDQLNPEISEQVKFIMVSVDPARDTAEVLSKYMPYFDAEFVGVTGEFLDIKRLSTQLNAAFVKVKQGPEIDNYSVDHSTNIALINPYGDYHGFIKAPLDTGRIKLTLQSVITMFDRSYSY